MARISTYVIDGTIVDGDKVIGSDANNSMVTKNYTVGDLTAYMAQSIGNDFLVPYINATDDVDLGLFNLSAGSLFLSGSISLDNTEGLEGQVLMSQGIGLPSVWGYNVGSQSLQDVVTIGNISNRSIKLSNVGSQVIDLDINGVYGTAGIKLSDNVNANTSHWDSKSLSLQDTSIGKTATYYSNKITYSNGTNTVRILPANYDNQTFILPVYGGVIPISINGVFADMSGNIIVDGTSTTTPNLQQVTDVGNTTTKDIWLKSSGYNVGGGLNIGDSLAITGSPSLRLTLAESATGLETYLKMGDRDLQSTYFVIQDLNGYDKFRFTTITEYVPAIDFTNAMYISSDTSYDGVYSMDDVGFFSNRSTATSYLQLTHLDSTVRLTAGVATGTLNTIALPNINAKTLAVSVNNNFADDNGNITIITGGVTNVTATLPLSSTEGETPDISISQADETTDGYLSFTDWNTFNNKLGSVPNLQAVTTAGASTSSNITISSSTNPQINITDGATAAVLAINSTSQKGYEHIHTLFDCFLLIE